MVRTVSALWVGQAGSLLLWAWLLGVLTMVYRFWPNSRRATLRGTTTGILMGYCCFLVAVMVFAAMRFTDFRGFAAGSSA